jgi:RND family efflux transporter MFP subunit
VGVVDPFTKVDVKSAVSGRIRALRVREGAVVKIGDVLAEVEPDVTQAQVLSDVQAAVIQAEVSLKDAERVLETQKQLYDSGLIGQQALKDHQTKRDLAAQLLKAAQTRYQIVEDHGIPISGGASSQVARVTSPMNGVVIKRGVELGDMVTSGVSSFNAGTVLFTVADLNSLIVRVNLNEVDIAKVSVGQAVRITLDAYPQKAFTGRVRFVAPAATLLEKIKVFAVEIALDELSDVYRTGMSANVEILGQKRANATSIPLEALQRREGQTVAYRLKKDLKPNQLAAARDGLSGRTKFMWLSEHWKDYFDVVPVDAGVATLERVEVVKGLASGDQVSLEDPTRKKVEKDEDN